MSKLKKISLLIFCFCAIIFLAGGCAVWKDLNTPIRKPKKAKKTKQLDKTKTKEPETFPDGSTVGLNNYEKAYLKGIDKNFKRREKQNYRKVFGISSP
jgi:hypothetical protein